MTLRPDEIEALLSGMLDGALAPAERDRLDQALLKDPALQQELEALSAIRSSLLKGRRHGRLGEDFSSKIVQAASVRASYEPELAPEWIPTLPRESVRRNKADATVPMHQRWWLPILSVAAAFVVAFLTLQLQRLDNNHSQNKISMNQPELPTEEGSAERIAIPNEATGIEATGIEATGIGHSVNPTDPLADTSIADASPGAADQGTADEGTANEATGKHIEKVAENASKPSVAPLEMTGPVATSPAATSPSATSPAAKPDLPAYVLMAVHVSQSQATADRQILQTILEKHNILSNDDLAISDEELSSLLATGAAGKIERDGANVYFLKGFARNLSGAIEDLCAQHLNFPEFGINITIDDSAKVLVHQLEEIDIGQSPAVAVRVGVQTPSGFATSFAPGRIIPRPMSQQRRESAAAGSMLASIDTNPMSHLLLIVRTDDEVDKSPQLESSPQNTVAD